MTNDKNELVKKEEENYIKIIDQSGIENAIGKLVLKNNSLLPSNIAVERIKNSAGFYIANREDLIEKAFSTPLSLPSHQARFRLRARATRHKAKTSFLQALQIALTTHRLYTPLF